MTYITDAAREYAKKQTNDMWHNKLTEKARKLKEKLFGKSTGGHVKPVESNGHFPPWVMNTIEAKNNAIHLLADENDKTAAIQQLHKHLEILHQTLNAAKEKDKASIERCIERTNEAIEKIQAYNDVNDSCAKDAKYTRENVTSFYPQFKMQALEALEKAKQILMPINQIGNDIDPVMPLGFDDNFDEKYEPFNEAFAQIEEAYNTIIYAIKSLKEFKD